MRLGLGLGLGLKKKFEWRTYSIVAPKIFAAHFRTKGMLNHDKVIFV